MGSDAAGGHFDRLVLRNVRCFREATIELHPQLTVLLGENGAGKTTVIEALASLTHAEEEGLPAFPLTHGAKSGEIAVYVAAVKRPVARWKAGGAGTRQRLPIDRPFLAYGRYRRVYFPDEDGSYPAPNPTLAELAARAYQGCTATVFRPDTHLLRDLARYLVVLHEARKSDPRIDATWKRLDSSLSQLGQGLTGITFDEGKTEWIPQVVRNGFPLELKELSDGYQAVLVIVFDLVLRYLYLFPTLEDPLLGRATVAIDEVDLHLHPRWQRTVAAQLTTLFPNTQFILTTHSPAVVQGAIDSRHQVVSLREETGQVTATSLTAKETEDLDGAEIGSVLLEEKLFSLDSRYSTKFSEVEERVNVIRKAISKGRATEEQRKQLFEDLGTLQRLVAEDEIRRADGSFMSQMSGLRKAFLEDLAAAIEKVKP
ncbi:MAG TPA: AAA family ATPase [Thermoanaerobaculia bacterium]|nr:AAA family ATPase [Thermoanaerobaculia bacterium]